MFSNLRYDDCFYEARVKQSVGPLYYHLYAGQLNNCQKCLPTVGPYTHGNWYDTHNKDLVDVETVLKQQNCPQAGCGRDKIHMLDVSAKNKDVYPKCSKFLDTMDTLLTHPKEHYR